MDEQCISGDKKSKGRVASPRLNARPEGRVFYALPDKQHSRVVIRPESSQKRQSGAF
jgi:hypothetical protein